jgi:RNA polymerase sigma-70 factor, ECF subfamily
VRPRGDRMTGTTGMADVKVGYDNGRNCPDISAAPVRVHDGKHEWVRLTIDLGVDPEWFAKCLPHWPSVLDGPLALHRNDPAAALRRLAGDIADRLVFSDLAWHGSGPWRRWYAALWAEAAVLDHRDDAPARIERSRHAARHFHSNQRRLDRARPACRQCRTAPQRDHQPPHSNAATWTDRGNRPTRPGVTTVAGRACRGDGGPDVADAETFDAFYSGSSQRLFDCLYALTGNPAEAQDAVHEAFARAWQRWDNVGSYADPEAWVRTVARRVAVSRWRRTRSALVAHRRHGPPADVPGPNADTVALITALARLPVAQRTALVLHHLVGLPVAEVAHETGVPVGTVKARLARGRRALAMLLDMTATEDTHA